MDSPLLSYIDVWHANFLPPQLTVGEAEEFGPRFTSAKSLVPVRDTSADLVSQSCRVHVPVGEPEAPVQVAEPAVDGSVNSSKVEANQGNEMATKRTMTIDRFLPGTRLIVQPQQP